MVAVQSTERTEPCSSSRRKLLEASELPARESYPPSYLISVYDENGGELKLMATEEVFRSLQKADRFTDVALVLRWRRLDLASLGGSGRGKAYRLSAIGLA